MTTWSAPSARFPAPASIAIELPEAWVPLQVPGAVLAAERPTDSRTYPPASLTVEIRRAAPGAQLADAIARFTLAMSAYPEAVVSREGALEATAGSRAYLHEMAYVAPGIGTVMQSSRLVLVGEQAPCLVIIQATVGGNRVETDYVEVQRALATIAIGPMP